MANEDVMEMLEAAIESELRNMEKPNYFLRKEAFALSSCNRWVARELLRYIKSHKDKILVCRVEDFRALMDRYACQAKSEDTTRIFSTAYDFATDVLDYILKF